ncbi:hypothetical protein PILCRDRAFT_811981 [Piloderma croceum F 1598]|uniref:Uncharacterized protein n=1 Tax=Piloderma croceum (strain F 1598) TaxID=765440 RepID=A0A0C3CKR2_PILCF|nr:hypothetical protein PILCRDRAFT_811981 [Piloderma croceum F 1598]
MSCPTMVITSAQNPLPKCSPNLMPFHLNYSGIAPISTYFRVKPATLHNESGHNTVQLSTETTKTTGIDTVVDPATSERVDAGDTGAGMDVNPFTQPSRTPKKSSLGARFVAAFRGRTVHGATVNLPKGYSGIVLRPDGDESGKGKSADDNKNEASSKSRKGRLARKTSRVDVDEDVNMDEGEGSLQEEENENGPVRTLNPTESFSSFVLWNPDLPVDEAKDEYLRSLTEWIPLAAEIHRYDE